MGLDVWRNENSLDTVFASVQMLTLLKEANTLALGYLSHPLYL